MKQRKTELAQVIWQDSYPKVVSIPAMLYGFAYWIGSGIFTWGILASIYSIAVHTLFYCIAGIPALHLIVRFYPRLVRNPITATVLGGVVAALFILLVILWLSDDIRYAFVVASVPCLYGAWTGCCVSQSMKKIESCGVLVAADTDREVRDVALGGDEEATQSD